MQSSSWSAGTHKCLGEILRNSWLPIGHKVWTQEGRRKTVGVDRQLLPMPWEAGLVLLPLFAGQLLWPLRRALLPKTSSSSTFISPFSQGHHLRLKTPLAREKKAACSLYRLPWLLLSWTSHPGDQSCTQALKTVKMLKWDVFCISFKFRGGFCVCTCMWICICVCMHVHVCINTPTHVL